MQTVLIKKEDRTQHSGNVSLNKESDTGQDVIKGRVDEDHLEGIEHFLAR
ncbi:MAG TPA: hypothetical protein VE422_09575 [Terriglobia bacterium]|nr:hypothetical protein [Terriglobia bacterium]